MPWTDDTDPCADGLHDPLTGGATRALFLDRLEHARARWGRRNQPLAIALLEIGAGDATPRGADAEASFLRTIAERCTTALRADDTVARESATEFALLLEDVTNAAGAQAAVHRVLEALRVPVAVAGRSLALTAHCGLAVSLPPHVGAPTLVQQATAALQRSKKHEQTGYALFDPQIDGRRAA